MFLMKVSDHLTSIAEVGERFKGGCFASVFVTSPLDTIEDLVSSAHGVEDSCDFVFGLPVDFNRRRWRLSSIS